MTARVYLQHFLGLFMHEGAHYNVAGPRKLNDLLTDLLLGTLQGYSIESYECRILGITVRSALPRTRSTTTSTHWTFVWSF
jgi:hypothetical protein